MASWSIGGRPRRLASCSVLAACLLGSAGVGATLTSPAEPVQALGQRDLRHWPFYGRAQLLAELQSLERLYQQTAEDSPDKIKLTRRLAEDNVALENVAASERAALDLEIQSARAKNVDNSPLVSDYTRAHELVEAAHADAIKYYELMRTRYPAYPKLDEVLYYLAYEYEGASQYDDAREVYLELIHRVPKSPFVPLAHVALGDRFFEEAKSDATKWDLALAAYEKAVTSPPPGNRMFGFAHYKLGYTYWNKGDRAHALSEFAKVAQFSQSYATLPNAVQLGRAARRALVTLYAEAGAPTQAFDFFRPLSGDEPGSNQKTLALLMRLGDAFRARHDEAAAVATYLQVLKRVKPGDTAVCAEFLHVLATLARSTPRIAELERRRAEACR